jgi:hypothetical protein
MLNSYVGNFSAFNASLVATSPYDFRAGLSPSSSSLKIAMRHSINLIIISNILDDSAAALRS